MKADARILLVDERPDAWIDVEPRLRALGCRTTVVVDGREAVAAARREPPDLAVVGVQLPEPNGYQVCREIKRVNSTIPVILVDAKADPADRYWAHASGADAFLARPVDAPLLLRRIVALLDEGVRRP